MLGKHQKANYMRNNHILYLSRALVHWIGYYYTRIISQIFIWHVEDQIVYSNKA